ncbi:Kinase-related protein of unknown function [Forsythia ovata]|uniref:GBF-interacting protein 1 N-terminal domain-containing protein n=1 Tax=Forsythia ovata TaxID=205694 RepID=A0ABD1NWG1_9LAMI
MSSGGKGAAATSSRVAIPGSVKKTIENIKEITGQSHSDDEIYAMLKECSMDPNETAQKLLLLDTFHEVKRKHNRRKENLNKESADSRWKPGVQARANKGGRGNYSSRYSHDTGSGRNYAVVKENIPAQISEKGVSAPLLPTSQESKRNETSVVSPITALSNGPSGMSSTSVLHETHATASRSVNQSDSTGDASTGKLEGLLPLSSPIDSTKNPDVAPGTRDIHGHRMLKSSNSSTPTSSATLSGAHFSSSDPVLFPSQDIRPPSATGTIRHEMDSQRTPVEQIAVNPTEGKSASAASVGSSIVPQMPNIFQGVGKNQLLESPKTASSTHDGSFFSRPSSNHNHRTQVIGPQKVGPGKEWKPKSTNPSIGQGASAAASSDVSTDLLEKHSELRPTPRVLSAKELTLELQRKLEETHILDSQHVIIPNHLHVPDAEKLGFCFGSFDASFELDISYNSGPESDKSLPLSESPEAIEETNELVAAEDTEATYPDNPPSSLQLENFSSTEGEVSSSVLPEYNESKQEVSPGSHQHPAHSSSNYSFGFVPPILSSQVSPLESSESQARDASQVPSFVVQQSFDPTSYYLQFYRPGAHSDGRISPFHSAGAASKYNGNAIMLSALTSQSLQEANGPKQLKWTQVRVVKIFAPAGFSLALMPNDEIRSPRRLQLLIGHLNDGKMVYFFEHWLSRLEFWIQIWGEDEFHNSIQASLW